MKQSPPIQPGEYAFLRGNQNQKVKIIKKVSIDPRRARKTPMAFPHYECLMLKKDGTFEKTAILIPLIALSSKAIPS
jgi:hypothetical protein